MYISSGTALEFFSRGCGVERMIFDDGYGFSKTTTVITQINNLI